MPIFYLHICNGTGFVEDEDGQELLDEGAARDAAIAGARDIMAGEIQRGELDLGSFIEVEDEDHRWLFTITFADALDLKRQAQPSPQGSTRNRTSQ